MKDTSNSQPNILVILTDQQRWDTVGAYGCPMGLTPNLDEMARRGVLFEKCFTCQPLCAPARGSLQTGKYATAHGVYHNASIPLPITERTLAHYFGDAGYDLGYVGKWHLGATAERPVPGPRRGGYDGFWEAADLVEYTSHPYAGHLFDAQNKPVPLGPYGYRVDALTARALAFLRQDRENPFYLFLSYLEPHDQNDMGQPVAPEGYAQRFANPWIPEDLKALPGSWRRELPDYYGCVARIDECIGQLLDELARLDQYDNTIVVFTSDHGCHFRTRNDRYKLSCHDASTHIPLIMQGPGLNEELVIEEVVSLVDLPETLLAAAGLQVPEVMQGRNTMPLIRGQQVAWNNETFIQISESLVGRALRTERWTYSVFAPDKDGRQDAGSDEYIEHHLYDNWADPHQQVNLIGRNEYRPVADELIQRLKAQMVAAGEPRPVIRQASSYS